MCLICNKECHRDRAVERDNSLNTSTANEEHKAKRRLRKRSSFIDRTDEATELARWTIAILDGTSDDYTLPKSWQPRSTQDLPPNLDKPLPQLPDEPPSLPGGWEVKGRAGNRLILGPAPSSFFGAKLRLGLFQKRKAAKRQAAEVALSAQTPTIMPVPAAPAIERAVESFSRPTYVEHGTQTSPRLLPVRLKEKTSVISIRKYSRGRRPTLAHQPSSASPLSKAKQDDGQKGFWVKMIPHDYFSIPFKSDMVATPESKSTSGAGTGSDATIGPNPKAIKANGIGVASEHDTSDAASTKSGDSIGSYESRYSTPGGHKSSIARPVLSRAAVSESAVSTDQHSMASSATEKPRARPQLHEHAASAPTHLPRPIPIPFTRFSSFAASRARRTGSRSDGGSSKSVSPLRHSLRLSESPPPLGDAGPSSPNVWRQAVITPEAEDESSSRIPDHLPGSPLCPRSPMHPSGGTGFCPMHKAGSASSASSGSRPKILPPPRMPDRSDSSAASVDGNSDTNSNVELGYHASDSPYCPNNLASGKNCMYHTRWQDMEFDNSPESIDSLRDKQGRWLGFTDCLPGYATMAQVSEPKPDLQSRARRR